MLRCLLLLLGLLIMHESVSAQVPYKHPPEVVRAVLDVPNPPTVSVSPTRDRIALVQSSRYPGIADVAEPMVRLAGLRINPRTNGPAREGAVLAVSFRKLDSDKAVTVKLPAGKPGTPNWSPDGKRFALLNRTEKGIELYVGDVETAELKLVPEIQLNAAIGDPFDWTPDSKSLLVQTIPSKRGAAPTAPLAPVGPTIQESSGKAAPVRTFQNMLKDAHDEALFEHYCTSQLGKVDATSLKFTPLGTPAVYTGAIPSPDGKYLLVTVLRKPYSYLYPYSAFPKAVRVWDEAGNVVTTVAELPLQDQVPIEGVPTGPRSISWVPTESSTLLWVEALDGGDPKKKVPFRDQIYWASAKGAEKIAILKTEHRFAGLSFFEDGKRVLLTDLDRDRKWRRTVLTTIGGSEQQVIFDRSINDRYNDPGTPLNKMLPNGQMVLRTTPDGELLLSGSGATPKGEFPTLNRFNLKSLDTAPLFQCRECFYESVAAILDDNGGKLLIRRESPKEPVNYFLKQGDKETQLTKNVDPFPELRKIKKQLITTKRADGVTISFTLYVPPDVPEGTKLPTVFWAYPREFNDASTASQVSGSPFRFTTIGSYSHLFFLTQGYAVMDEVSMPIVGSPETANNTFIEQLRMNAEAAIEKACEVGPIDRNRIGIGGHSYGAFMTANLLAHSDLFRAGIARSGAYNRTLTPFGFQNERRTFWEAPEIYSKMSPFNNAHKVNEPLLLIHGQADSNPGTFPVQSERMYQAVRGNGGIVRLVLLPHEDHGYSAKESIEHVLAEQIGWFDKYVKNAVPREKTK
jgi:dipeptidyl aminopeptidase/acylaminoacyl peptidase